jgi:hypothetical protein
MIRPIDIAAGMYSERHGEVFEALADKAMEGRI